MKTIYEHDLGGNGGKIGAYVDGADLVIAAREPLSVMTSPATSFIGGMVDKLEHVIPGDQTAIAEKIKAEITLKVSELLAEKLG